MKVIKNIYKILSKIICLGRKKSLFKLNVCEPNQNFSKGQLNVN